MRRNTTEEPRKPHNKRKVTIACLLTLCLVAGMFPFVDPAYAASSFTYNSPFSGTSYGTGSGDKTYTHNGKFSGNLIVNGVDVSAYQSTKSNWATAKKKGVDYAIMRVTWTGYRKDKHAYKNLDSSFETNFKKAKAADVMVGCYVFSQAKTVTEAQNEAKYAVKRLQSLGIEPDDLDLPVYMDYEFAGGTDGRLYGLKKATATKCAKAFTDTIRELGYEPGIYASKSFFVNYIDVDQLGSDVDLWCAQYWYKCAYGEDYTKWQYSSTAKIGSGTNGILSSSTGKVSSTDVDFWYIDKSKHTLPISEIYGVTELNYTGKPVKPEFEIYNGETLLKEDRDYVVRGITNVSKGTNTAYAYIAGIGNYSGYAVVPFTIGSGFTDHLGLGKCEDSSGDLIFSNAYITTDVTKHLIRFFDAEGNELSSKYYEEGTAADQIEIPDVEETDFTGWVSDGGEGLSDVVAPADYVATYAVTEKDAAADEEEQTEEAAAAAETTEETAEEETAEVTSEETTEETEAAAAEESDVKKTVVETVVSDETVYDFDIDTGSIGSYVRDVPSGLTVSEFLDGLALDEDYTADHSLGVINNYGIAVSAATTLRTGMRLAVYKEGTLIGDADITVNGDSILGTSNYTSAAKKITVPKTYITKLTRYKKAFKVKVAKKSKSSVTGYQVRYSLKKNMSGAKIKTIGTKYTAVTKKITGLKSKKRYYVQVRSYRLVNGKRYYSAWSAKKSVKTK